MIYQQIKRVCVFAIFAAVCASNSFGENASSPIELHEKYPRNTLPIAIFKSIKIDDFRKLIVTAFEASNFSLVSVSENQGIDTLYKFSYSIFFDGMSQSVNLVVRTNETKDSKKRCADCFLRLPQQIANADIKTMPWMTQYEMSSKIFPAVDKAYAEIQRNGQKYMDQKFGFNYKNNWDGERNLWPSGNAFTGIALSDLKRDVTQAYIDAGFVFLKESSQVPKANTLELVFSFPIDTEKKEGAVYKLRFLNQFSLNEICYPCEVSENYDPHQRLPAAGFLGIADRLTLESRFIAARARAFEEVKTQTARYLRPRTVFSVPPQPAPLGSHRAMVPPT